MGSFFLVGRGGGGGGGGGGGALSKNVGRQIAADTGKKLSLFTNFPANMFLFGVRICFCLVSEKVFALPHILTPKNYFLEAL